MAGTSLIADILEDLTGDAVHTQTLLPSASCPSQFDMKPGEIARLRKASLVVLHPWQMDLANIRRVIEAARIPAECLHVVDAPGNWMLPEGQVEATRALATLMASRQPDKAMHIQERAEARIARTESVAREIRARLAPLIVADTTVLCNTMQAPFIRWAGMEIAAAYGRPEDWSVADVESLMRTGRERNVLLVVDNLQSGGLRMSETLARDIGVASVVLSNFPGGFPGTPTWEATFSDNARRLVDALQQ